MLIIDNNYPACLHNQKNIRIFALRKVRNDINVIAIAWTISREEMYKIIIFDFDGTIADTNKCIIETFQQHVCPTAARKFSTKITVPPKFLLPEIAVSPKSLPQFFINNQVQNSSFPSATISPPHFGQVWRFHRRMFILLHLGHRRPASLLKEGATSPIIPPTTMFCTV